MIAEMVEDWDSYLCMIEEAPASIFVDMAYYGATSPPDVDTMYAVRIGMVAAGEHGLGEQQEAEDLYPVEEAIAGIAADSALLYIGRVRHRGVWQMAFMGRAGCQEAAELAARTALAAVSGERPFDVLVQRDPEWSYYREFLYPSEERRRWMRNRRAVSALQERGDPLAASRPVQHFVYFGAADDRRRFAAAANALGFACRESDQDAGERPFGLHMHRDDPVALDSIHPLSNELADLAAEHAGLYDGWETKVQK